MATILDELADYARLRVEKAKAVRSAEEVKSLALAMPEGNFAFEKTLKKDDIAFICECKKASPSKGIIAEDFPYLEIARQYEAAGADCISVLTEPKWFLGSDAYLERIAKTVNIPCIRKDFTVDEYMIYEAKLLGASAVLLICSILPEETIKKIYRDMRHARTFRTRGNAQRGRSQNGCQSRRKSYRRKQPQSQRLLGRYRKQQEAAQYNPRQCGICFGERNTKCR